MLPTDSSLPHSRRRNRLALAAALVAVGCSGSNGGGCAGSCGGALKTIPTPVLTGAKTSRLDNVAQLRVTKSGFSFLNEQHLNEILGNLNAGAAGLAVPCIDAGELVKCSSFPYTLTAHVLAGDTNFDGACEAGEKTPIHIEFKKLSWGLDKDHQQLKMHLVAHIHTGDIYVRTVEEHSSICPSPIQGRLYYDDELDPLNPPDTSLDLAFQFSTAPDGRLQLNLNQDSLNTAVDSFNPGTINFDGYAGTDPAPPANGTYVNNGCDAKAATSYATVDPSNPQNLTCGAIFRDITANCPTSDAKWYCPVYFGLRDQLLNYLKNTFKAQIAGLLRSQFDKIRCEGSYQADFTPIACDANHACPSDDDGHPLLCDNSRGVCGQSSTTPANFDCEPVPLGLQGTLDLTELTSKVGFPANTQLQIFAGLGSKHAGANIDSNGAQFSLQAGTAPANGVVSFCVRPAFPVKFQDPPTLNFDDPLNKPTSVNDYQVGFAIASQMLNRAFYDSYNAGLMCIALTNQTTPFISTSLFKTFLPSLGPITGGRDVPMQILLRPSQPPFVRIGKGDLTTNSDGTVTIGDPLVSLSFTGLNLDFYALVDERQVRLFTLTTDLLLPLSLRTYPFPKEDTLVPVLGSLDSVLTNIKASNNQMLAEDPGVIKDLLGAAIKLAEPLLAGVLKPIALPKVLGLDFQVAGIAGVVPLQNVTTEGYAHLALYMAIAQCGTVGGPACERVTLRTDARIVSHNMPEDPDAVRAGERPSVTIEASGHSAHVNSVAQFSYRIDSGLWFPWVGGPRFTIDDRRLMFPGHHHIEVIAREAGDDRSADQTGVSLDFFTSYEPPSVELVLRSSDGSIFTRAHSDASPDSALLYSYRIDGENRWTEPGPARDFSAGELGGRGLSVSVSDEGGRAASAHYGEIGEANPLSQAGLAGCSTSPQTGSWLLFWPLLAAAALKLRRRRAA